MAVDPARAKSLFLEASDLASRAERAAYLDRECGAEAELRARVEALLAAHDKAGPFPEPNATTAVESTSPETLPGTATSAAETAAETGTTTAGSLENVETSDLGMRLAAEQLTREHGSEKPTANDKGAARAERSGKCVADQVIAGRYTLREVLGEGGMGTVYRADQTEPVKRQVALKIIRIGMDSRTVLARFNAERQALALMDHPNIARVFDGGTTDAGQPFFVMELVQGVPITDYCDSKRFSVRARLELFVAVCQAVQHAHQKGIIHRDIKPSNVMVTEVDGRPMPKVIDFGVAKATEFDLTDQSLADTGAIVGTPTHMSPEQADPTSMDIDTRTDIYALGVILYELLAGSPPLDSAQMKRRALLEMLRMVREIDPPKPSMKVSTSDALPNLAANRGIDPAQLKRALSGDLDWIVMKALEKDRRRRYESANGFAADVLRHLSNEPVLAAPPSRAYRLRKFVRRHRGGVIAASLVLIALLAGIAGTTWGMIRANRARDAGALQRQLAEEEKRKAEQSEAVANAQRARADQARIEASRREDEAKRTRSAVARLALAQDGHADRGLLLMLEALKTAPDDARELRKMVRWNLGAWLGQVHKTLRIIDTGGPCDSLAFSPDGRSFATGCNPRDHSHATPIDLWDTASGQKLSSVPNAFAPMAFRGDGKALVAHDDQRRLVAIDLTTRRVLWTSPQTSRAYDEKIAFDPHDSTILVTTWISRVDWQMLRLDASTGKQLGEPIGRGAPMVVAADGSTVATRRVESGKAYIDVLSLTSGRRTASWQTELNESYSFQMVFSPDVRSLFVSRPKGVLLSQSTDIGQLWDPVTARPITAPMTSTTTGCYLPSADYLVTRTHDRWLVRDARNGRVRGSGSFAGAERYVAEHPDGRTMLAASGEGVIRMWQISPEAEPLANTGADTEASTSGIEPDRRMRDVLLFSGGLGLSGQIAISTSTGAGGGGVVRLYDPATGRPLGRPASHYPGWKLRNLALSPDGRCFATGSHPDGRTAGEVRLWETSTGRLKCPPMPQSNYVGALAFQPDGRVLASGDYSGLVRLWDASTGRELGRPLNQGEIVLSLTFSPDGKVLAVGLANDHTGKAGVRLWNTATRQPIGGLLPSTHNVTRIEFEPGGHALIANHDGRVELFTSRLWDVAGARAIGEAMIEEVSGGFRPDGRAFLAMGIDGTVKLRDAATGTILTNLLTTSSRATCAAFRDDGGLVAAGFEDGTVRLCDPATSHPVGPPRSMNRAVVHVAFRSNARRIVALDEFGECRTWPVPEPPEDESIDDLTLRIEALTGLRMEPGLAITRLDTAAWRDRLEQLGRRDPTAVQPNHDPAWHEPMVLEAEQNGNAFAAIWHLDRLIAARPDDWLLLARRARARTSSKKFEQAASDYRQAERLGSREQVLDFQAHCVVDCTEAGRWAEALWYLQRLIAARPDDVTLHEDLAAIYGKLDREADRQAELARVFELGGNQELVILRAEELGRADRWAEAARLLARSARNGPLSRELAQAWAIACLKAGDRAGYREACAAFMANQGPDPTVVWNALAAASFLALGVDGVDDYRVAMGWCENRLSAVPAPSPRSRHNLSNALGGLLLRAGRIDEAIDRLNEGIAAATEAHDGDFPTDWAYLSLAHARKRDIAEARRWLERLRALRLDSSASFWDLQELALLRCEAESTLFDAEFPKDPFQRPGPR